MAEQSLKENGIEIEGEISENKILGKRPKTDNPEEEVKQIETKDE